MVIQGKEESTVFYMPLNKMNEIQEALCKCLENEDDFCCVDVNDTFVLIPFTNLYYATAITLKKIA